MSMKTRSFLLAAATALGASACVDIDTSTEEQESHSWGNYHWARQSNPFNLKLGDNVSSAWDSYLGTTSSDWSQSQVLDTTIVAGGAGNAKRCRATSGRVEVCNSSYGNNGWLGIAQIWAQGSHITQGVVKVNDYYFNSPTYNSPAWRNLVMCQEVGHTLGLAHNDEDFNTTNGTCMDYSNNPEPNQHPDQHDYEQLELIYAHLDSTTTVGLVPSEMQQELSAEGTWGELRRASDDGRVHEFVRDFGNGWTLVTTVTWAD